MANIIAEISDEGMPALPDEDDSTPLILGSTMNITDPLVKIADLNAESGNVCIDGEIQAMEDKETKSGKVILSIDIYDGSSTMTCKAFLPANNAKKIVNKMPTNHLNNDPKKELNLSNFILLDRFPIIAKQNDKVKIGIIIFEKTCADIFEKIANVG